MSTIPDSSDRTALLRTGAVVAVLAGRGSLSLKGPDCAELLHGLLTNDVKGLRPGSGCHAAFLTPKGKLRAEMAVLRLTAEELLLDCEPSLAAPLLAALSGYVPFSRSTMEDRTATTGVVHLEGPASAGILASAGIAEPAAAPFSHLSAEAAGATVRVVRVSRSGEEGFDLQSGPDTPDRLLALFSGLGAAAVGPETLEAGRIEAGLPRWGAELDETVLPNEAWLERTAISYTKGCYLGQETVARLKTYGHVNRHLVAILLPHGCAVAAGDVVRAGEEKVGRVTSAVDSALRGCRVALAYVRREHETQGTPLIVDSPSGPAEGIVAAIPLGR
ncbi:MAG: aminomethyl transferase family protein [Holophagales bacterium]|nr:aminomethyl transferase family protein [Holophagales bacterium]MBK9968220.1 aminomethyl transferase family protein [Holophagales bacterium]